MEKRNDAVRSAYNSHSPSGLSHSVYHPGLYRDICRYSGGRPVHRSCRGLNVPFINAANVMRLIRNYRVLFIGGRFGGGKTSLAFRIAYDLKIKGDVRYIFANTHSIWNDNPDDVVLRENDNGKKQFVDAVLILDEGGLFLETGWEAKAFIAFLRKMNIIVIIPSYEPPALKLKTLTIQRVFNWQAIGLPLWQYRLDLNFMKVKSKENFFWWQPNEVFGLYDTQGMPEDDAYFSTYFKEWQRQAQDAQGYERKKLTFFTAQNSIIPLSDNPPRDKGGLPEVSNDGGVGQVEIFRRLTSTLEESAQAYTDAVSILAEQKSNKRGRKY